MKKHLTFISVSILVSACSSVPPDQEFGFGGGYKDKEVSHGVYELYYAGNGFATLEGVKEAWHRRASQLCGGDKYEHEFSFDGTKNYDIYSGVSFMPVTMGFPEVIGIVRCSS